MAVLNVSLKRAGLASTDFGRSEPSRRDLGCPGRERHEDLLHTPVSSELWGRMSLHRMLSSLSCSPRRPWTP